MACNWPEGTCACYLKQSSESDPFGRVWMHCEQGLSMTNASMSRFMLFCLKNKIEIGSVDAFRPDIRGCSVHASIRIHPSKIEEFEAEVKAELRPPPRVKVNSAR